MGELDSLVIRNYARQLLCGLRHLHEHLLYMNGIYQEDVLLAGRGKVKLSNVREMIYKCIISLYFTIIYLLVNIVLVRTDIY